MKRSPIGRISIAGSLRQNSGVSFSSMRILGSYALVYLTSGGGHFQTRGQAPVRCRAGDLLLIFPEIPHGYGPPRGGRWSEIYVVFSGPVFDLWRQQGILSPARPVLRLLPVATHARKLRGVLAGNRGGNPAGQLARVCALQSFLASALASAEADESSADSWPDWLEKAVAKLRLDPTLGLESVARTSGLSYESFRKKFRALTGESPARFRSRMVFDLAGKLIYEERLSNKELAEKLGFCDEFHFSRRFHQSTGQTPSQFRSGLPG